LNFGASHDSRAVIDRPFCESENLIRNFQHMAQTEWFDRKFPPIADNGLLPNIIERLEGTPARISAKVSTITVFPSPGSSGRWSIKKEIGHLSDLEPLWLKRTLQIIDNIPLLEVTDITNQKTQKANHDERGIEDLVAEFKESRQQLVDVLRKVKDEDLNKSALHPRLGIPMKIIDLAYFVAEHDDHHLAKITAVSGVIK
jgi:uncharacterized damage-inducible protein DinB